MGVGEVGGGDRNEDGDGDEDLGKKKGYDHEGSEVECCTIWRPQWVGDGSQNHKANAFLGTCNPQSPPPRPALAL